jgi:hypothetical protein
VPPHKKDANAGAKRLARIVSAAFSGAKQREREILKETKTQ